MEAHEIRAMLQYPDAGLVQFAVDRANLNSDEWMTIRLREYDCQSIERAAETLDVSPGTVKNRYSSGMQKLNKCWGATPWINSIIKS